MENDLRLNVTNIKALELVKCIGYQLYVCGLPTVHTRTYCIFFLGAAPTQVT